MTQGSLVQMSLIKVTQGCSPVQMNLIKVTRGSPVQMGTTPHTPHNMIAGIGLLIRIILVVMCTLMIHVCGYVYCVYTFIKQHRHMYTVYHHSYFCISIGMCIYKLVSCTSKSLSLMLVKVHKVRRHLIIEKLTINNQMSSVSLVHWHP